MTTLTNIGSFGGELPTLKCSACDVQFNLCWNRQPGIDGPEFCPFCGQDVDEINWEEPDDS